MSNLAIVQERVRTIELVKDSKKEQSIIRGIFSFIVHILSSQTEDREYYFDLSFTDGTQEEIIYKKSHATKMEKNGWVEDVGYDQRNDKIIAIAHSLSLKGFNVDEAQLALFMSGKIQRLICKKK